MSHDDAIEDIEQLIRVCQEIEDIPEMADRIPLARERERLELRLTTYPPTIAMAVMLQVFRPFIAPEPAALPKSAEGRRGVHRAWRILESLYPVHSPAPHPVPAETPLPEHLDGLIGVMRELSEARRRQAMVDILAHGSVAVPALEDALARTSSPLVQARLAYLLAMLGEVRLLCVLWGAYQEALTSEVAGLLEKSLRRMAQTLENAPEKLPLTDLIDVFIATRNNLPALAESLARGLTRLARTHPTPALRAALPHLHGSWLTPLPPALREARDAIEVATKEGADLPLPATEPEELDNLPRPVQWSQWEATDDEKQVIDKAIEDLNHPTYLRRMASIATLSSVVGQDEARTIGPILAALVFALHKQEDNDNESQNYILKLVKTIKYSRFITIVPDSVVTSDLISLIQFFQTANNDKKFLLASIILPCARWLQQIAQNRPTPELSAAIPYLVVNNPWTPIEFISVRRSVERAVKSLQIDLPLPATEPENSNNLPRPSEEKIE